MTIGIVDLDLLVFPQRYKLNLDIMQLSAYHKRRGDRVELCRSKKKEDLMWFNEIVVVYNGEDEVYIDDLIRDTRVTLIGKYFYGKSSKLPQEVLDTYPDRTIYDEVLESDLLSIALRTTLRNILKKADFIRLREPSNLHFISDTSKELILFDQDLNENDFEKIASFNKDFTIYYPIEIRSYQQAQRWIQAKAFRNGDNTHMFLANCFIEKDLEQLLQQPPSIRKMFCIQFGGCSPEYYSLELKKMLRFCQKAKLLTPAPKIKLAPITDKEYDFLFNCVKKWYNSAKANINKDIIHTYFKTKEHFVLGAKIKVKDVELYKLLTSTLTTRYQDEQSKSGYRRVD